MKVKFEITAIPDRCGGKHGEYDQIKTIFVAEKG